jgi:hypothetical protein
MLGGAAVQSMAADVSLKLILACMACPNQQICKAGLAEIIIQDIMGRGGGCRGRTGSPPPRFPLACIC